MDQIKKGEWNSMHTKGTHLSDAPFENQKTLSQYLQQGLSMFFFKRFIGYLSFTSS